MGLILSEEGDCWVQKMLVAALGLSSVLGNSRFERGAT